MVLLASFSATLIPEWLLQPCRMHLLFYFFYSFANGRKLYPADFHALPPLRRSSGQVATASSKPLVLLRFCQLVGDGWPRFFRNPQKRGHHFRVELRA